MPASSHLSDLPFKSVDGVRKENVDFPIPELLEVSIGSDINFLYSALVVAKYDGSNSLALKVWREIKTQTG